MVAENKSILRRASLFVRDMKRSIDFYAGAFGLSVYADMNVPLTAVPSFPVGDAGGHGVLRLVVLRGRDPLAGMIGLMEVGDPPLPNRDTTQRLGLGDVALVLESDNADTTAAAIDRLGGTVIMPPAGGRNLGDAEGNLVLARVMMARDPDGYFLEVFEVLSDE